MEQYEASKKGTFMSDMEKLESVNVMGVDYAIEYVDVVNKINPEYGEVDLLGSVIRIDKNLSNDMRQVTLIHELLHCICLGLGLYDITENETTIQSLATALHDVWKCNFTAESFPRCLQKDDLEGASVVRPK